jgi:sugar/nucleoside kinase (ribokinase family)
MKKILGIGSTLVDILSQVPNEEVLNELNLPKGSMTYVNINDAVSIGERLAQQYGSQRAAGDSAANTMSGLARLGAKSGFLTMMGNDEMGQFFTNEMTRTGVEMLALKSDTPTGRVIAMVTPDGERTFATCLGASIELSPDDIKPELFDNWDIFYIEGYLVANPDMLRKAISTAKDKGLKIAIDLASYNVVEESRDFLLELVNNYVDIVFANEQEALALTGMEPENALHYIAERCEIAVVKVGAKGAYIRRGNETATIAPMKANVIDTNGAGDMWAAGFMAGLVKDEPLEKCGKMGAIVAANVIEVLGTKMDAERWNKIHASIAKL